MTSSLQQFATSLLQRRRSGKEKRAGAKNYEGKRERDPSQPPTTISGGGTDQSSPPSSAASESPSPFKLQPCSSLPSVNNCGVVVSSPTSPERKNFFTFQDENKNLSSTVNGNKTIVHRLDRLDSKGSIAQLSFMLKSNDSALPIPKSSNVVIGENNVAVVNGKTAAMVQPIVNVNNNNNNLVVTTASKFPNDDLKIVEGM